MSIKHFLYCTLFLLFQNTHSKYTLILDAAGDAKHSGRSIDGIFERGLTLQCIQAIKQNLGSCNNTIEIITTQNALQDHHLSASAIFTNRMQPNLYIKLGFYQKFCKPCDWTLYRYSTNPADELHKTNNQLIFYEISQAHLSNSHITKQIAEQFFHTLQQPSSKIANYAHGLLAIPINPLYGIQVPCLYFEAGLFQATDWELFVKPLCDAISTVLS